MLLSTTVDSGEKFVFVFELATQVKKRRYFHFSKAGFSLILNSTLFLYNPNLSFCFIHFVCLSNAHSDNLLFFPPLKLLSTQRSAQRVGVSFSSAHVCQHFVLAL